MAVYQAPPSLVFSRQERWSGLPFPSPMKVKSESEVAQSCPTLCDPMDYAVRGILQVRILEWIAVPFFKESSQCRDEPRSPTLQADSLPAEPLGKPDHWEVPV